MKCPACNCNLDVRLIKAPASSGAPAEASGDLGELLESIDVETLEGASAKFVRETQARFEQYGDKTRMSEKQMAWLKRIASGEDASW